MAAALCYGSRGGGAQLAFHHQVGAYNTDTLIDALGQLRQFLGGQKATLLWDGLPAHRSKLMRAWLRRQRSWLVVEPLPAYAPELNPVEALWSNLKGWSWPTSPARASTTSLRRPSVASSGSATPTTWPSRSCGTAACPCGEPAARQTSAGGCAA
jgi:transposase